MHDAAELEIAPSDSEDERFEIQFEEDAPYTFDRMLLNSLGDNTENEVQSTATEPDNNPGDNRTPPSGEGVMGEGRD